MLRVNVKVIPRSKKTKIERLSKNEFKVHLTAPPVDGAANEQLIELLAAYFGVKKRQVRIVQGEKGRKKVVEILETSDFLETVPDIHKKLKAAEKDIAAGCYTVWKGRGKM